jgi:hypothetical protein
MLLKEITALSSDNCTKHANTPWRLNIIAGIEAAWIFYCKPFKNIFMDHPKNMSL